MMRIFYFIFFLSQFSFANPNDSVRELFTQSTRYDLWKIKNQELTLGKNAQLSWLPLRLESSLYRTMPFYGDKEQTAITSGVVQEHADVLSLNLTYSDFSSLTNTFSAQYQRNQYDEALSALNNARSYDLSNRIEYNITNSAGNSNLRINQGLELVSLNLSELQAIRSLNSEYLDFLQKVLSYYIYECKLKTQTQIKDLVDETIKKGKVLLSINAISKKDFLNYENIQIELERSIATINNDLLQAKFDAEALGVELDSSVSREKFIGLCKLSQNRAMIVSKEDLKKNLDFEILQKQIELNSLQLKSEKRDLISDVKPFLELGVASGLNQDAKDYRIVAGVSMGWDLPNARMKREVKFKEYSKNYTAGDYQLTKKRVEFEAQSLKQDLKYLNQIIDITNRNLKSNDDLLKILALENSLRRGDSLNYFNTVNNRISLINNYYDLILQTEVKLAQYTLLQDGKYLVNK